MLSPSNLFNGFQIYEVGLWNKKEIVCTHVYSIRVKISNELSIVDLALIHTSISHLIRSGKMGLNVSEVKNIDPCQPVRTAQADMG